MRISQEVSFSRGYRQVALCLSVLMEECSQTNESAMLRSEDLKRRREEQCYHQRKGRGQENYWAEEARPKAMGSPSFKKSQRQLRRRPDTHH